MKSSWLKFDGFKISYREPTLDELKKELITTKRKVNFIWNWIYKIKQKFLTN